MWPSATSVTQQDSDFEEEWEGEEEEENVSSLEDEWTNWREIPLWRGTSKLPQEIKSEEEPFPEPIVLSSTSDDDDPPKPRKPSKKFFERPNFFWKKNRPVLPRAFWDEEENLDNIETLMRRSIDGSELDAAVMTGVLDNLVPNHGFDDVIYKEASPDPPATPDSNFDLILSSSDDEKIPKLKTDHYKELVLVDDRIIDCQSSRKVCNTVFPYKYFGMPKIIERKEKMKNQKATKGVWDGISVNEAGSFAPSETGRRKRWKLKEPFPRKDSIEKNLSFSSAVDVISDSAKKIDNLCSAPSKLYRRCKWYDDCAFKTLLRQGMRREKKLVTLKADTDFDIDEILDDLFSLGRNPQNNAVLTLVDDFSRYKNEFTRCFDQDNVQKNAVDTELIQFWPDPNYKEEPVEEAINQPGIASSTQQRKVSIRLYGKVARDEETPRARVEARLAAERALDMQKTKTIIRKKNKPIEINVEGLPAAMEEYYKHKEDYRRRRERDGKPKEDREAGAHGKGGHDPTKTPVPVLSEMSLYPSYTKLIPPYSNVCKERLRKTLKNHRKTLNRELQSLADQQTFALAGLTLKRMYTMSISKGEPMPGLKCTEEARLMKLLAH